MDADRERSAACCELVREVARSSGELCVKVTGISMLPAVWPGDIIIVRRCKVAELQPKQIVLFTWLGELRAHRIVHIASDHVITRGDSLPCDDQPVYVPDILGQVVDILRNGRHIRTEQKFWQRAACIVLRRSDFCIRMALFVGNRRWRASAESTRDVTAHHRQPIAIRNDP